MKLRQLNFRSLRKLVFCNIVNLIYDPFIVGSALRHLEMDKHSEFRRDPH